MIGCLVAGASRTSGLRQCRGAAAGLIIPPAFLSMIENKITTFISAVTFQKVSLALLGSHSLPAQSAPLMLHMISH